MGWGERFENMKYEELFTHPVCAHARQYSGADRWEEFWSDVKEGNSKGCCYVLDIFEKGEFGELHAELSLSGTDSRSVIMRLGGEISAEIKLSVKLSGAAKFGLNTLGMILKNEGLFIDVVSSQEGSDSQMMMNGRLACADKGKIEIGTFGKIEKGVNEASCTYDVKVLQAGTGGVVKGRPHMEVGSDDVVADHGFSVGRMPEDVGLYMGTRGVEREDAELLYVKGFLGRGALSV